ncbi:isoleucine--tRNA ligase [Candidatus Deianiraea vastatrix]|uniref:Isoleucine--tRNA ligase n=1 Tax=Candidatus Deianiraea vastatrix TaxID=2163644 RepID=A0A5B8XH89_9RICK|nr:Isoleucine--tRNA ligase [Candidatus Deianiraea vastatrix]
MSDNKQLLDDKSITKAWKDAGIFEKSVEKNNPQGDYIFFDGPPFANGLPHYGHLLTGFVKDVFARYHTMFGKRCERKFGWDCHGLPAEMEAEKELKITGRLAIKDFSGNAKSQSMSHYALETFMKTEEYKGLLQQDRQIIADYIDKLKRVEPAVCEKTASIMEKTEFYKSIPDQIFDENGKKLEGIAAFNEHCRSSVMKYTNEWEDYVTKQGRWVDFENSYKTMDLPYMQSVISAFGKLFEKGLIYESTRVMAYSWKCQTPLSNFETKMDNSYREKESKTCVVKFRLTNESKIELQSRIKVDLSGAKNAYFLAWTTTPWTLPSNLALAVGRDIEYSLCKKNDEILIIASVLAGRFKKELDGYDEIIKIRGEILENLAYEPLFPYFKDTQNAFRVLVGDFVGADDGTGIVHMAPGFGEDDFNLCRANQIPALCPIDDGGKFVPSIFPILYDFGDFYNILSGQIAPLEGTGFEFTKGDIYIKNPDYNWDFIKKIVAYCYQKNMPLFAVNIFVHKSVKITDEKWKLQYFKYENEDKTLVSELQNADEIKIYIDNLSEFLAEFPGLFLANRCVLEESTNDKGKKNYDGVNEDVIKYLKSQNLWLKTEQYLHNYPHCWRTDTPLIYKAVSSWYVNVAGDGQGEVKIETASGKKTVKERMIELNQGINWIPDHIRDGQFGRWIECARDWSISRNRFFGCPIPVWRSSVHRTLSFNAIGDKLLLKFENSPELRYSDFEQFKSNFNSDFKEIANHLNNSFGSIQIGSIAKMGNLMIKNINDFIHIIQNLYHAYKSQNEFVLVNDKKMHFDIGLGMIYTFSSISEMEEFFRDDYISDFKAGKNSGKYMQKDGSFKITDLHRPYVDELVKYEDGFELRRIEDVFDCWFESGSMPFASVGFTFGEKNQMPHNFPADFIVEYVAQTRGWFYTLMILGTALFDKAPFKNCICHGVILDANGQKLSKRLRNYPDPMEMFDKYGSDAMRWFLLSSPVMRGGDLYMDETGEQIRDVSRTVITPFLSAFNFFKTYAKIDNIKCENIIEKTAKLEINRYILSLTVDTIAKIKTAIENYDTPSACSAFEEFLESLNNFYIRRNKDVFWESGISEGKQESFNTLYSVLLNVSLAIAPLAPFTTEVIFDGIGA